MYDIEHDEWSRLPNMREFRSDSSCLVTNDMLFVAGGFNGESYLKSVEYYDFRNTNCWVKLADLNYMRSGMNLHIYDNRLIAIGGYNGPNPTVRYRDGEKNVEGIRHDSVESLNIFQLEADEKYLIKQEAELLELKWKKMKAYLNVGRSNFGSCVIKAKKTQKI